METPTLIIVIIAMVAAVACLFLVMNSKANMAREARQDEFKCQQNAIEENRKHERWLEERRALREEKLKPEFTRAEFEAVERRLKLMDEKIKTLEHNLEVHLVQAKKVLDSAQTAANQAGLALGVRRFPPAREG